MNNLIKKLFGIDNSDNLSTEIVRSSNNAGNVLTSYSLTAGNTESVTLSMTASSASFNVGEYVEFRTTSTGGYQGWESEIK